MDLTHKEQKQVDAQVNTHQADKLDEPQALFTSKSQEILSTEDEAHQVISKLEKSNMQDHMAP